jgi:tetrahydromethanopterin S-methyltransferase subunit A
MRAVVEVLDEVKVEDHQEVDLENHIQEVEEMDLGILEEDQTHDLLELEEVHEEAENHLEGKAMDGRSRKIILLT